MHEAQPQAFVAVGLWRLPPEGAARAVEAIRSAADCFIYTGMGQAVEGIVSRSSPAGQENPAIQRRLFASRFFHVLNKHLALGEIRQVRNVLPKNLLLRF